jgi:hypothetical protein
MFNSTTLVFPLYNHGQPAGSLSSEIPISISKHLVELSTQLSSFFTPFHTINHTLYHRHAIRRPSTVL